MESQPHAGTTNSSSHGVQNMANSNAHESNALQYPQGLIPGLNYMPAAFPMPANGELALGGQTMMHPLQQLGAMPFFGQGGGQFLMPASGMPVFLHPGFQMAPGGQMMGAATSPQSQNSSQTQQARDGSGGSRTGTPQQSDANRLTVASSTQDGAPSAFPGMFPQQLQLFSHLPQFYMQPSMHQLPSSSGEQSISLAQNAGIDATAAFGNPAAVFPEGFAGMSMPGFPIPVAFPGIAPPQLAATTQAAAAQKEDPNKGLKPPKRPLTPYMRFSKAMWTTVKSSYPDMTVCEIGATIGRLWRELTNEQKEKYNEDFMRDKQRYDDELQQYLKITGLQASDLTKPRSKKKEPAAPKSSSHNRQQASASSSSSSQQSAQLAQQPQGQQAMAMGGLLMPGQAPNGPGSHNPWLM